MITGLKLLSICVEDQERALEFYTKKLGFELRDDQPAGEDERWIEVAPPGGNVIIALTKQESPDDRVGKSVQIEFQCADVQATYDELVKRGVKFTAKPEEAPWGGWAAQFVDEEGNEFLLGN